MFAGELGMVPDNRNRLLATKEIAINSECNNTTTTTAFP